MKKEVKRPKHCKNKPCKNLLGSHNKSGICSNCATHRCPPRKND